MTNAEKLYEMGLDALDNNDEDAAFSFLNQAAQEGLAKAQFELGVMYENGQGTDVDRALAMQWYEKAADQGLAEAQFNYGYMLMAGDGEQEKADGLNWIKKAADQGDEAAVEYLGAMETEADKKRRIEAAEKKRKAFAAGIRKMARIHVIISNFTRLPYMAMAKDGKTFSVLVYDTAAAAKQQIEQMKTRRELASVQDIDRNQIIPFFESLYLHGFNNALFMTQDGIYPVALMEIVRKKLPPKNFRIIENPQLMRSGMFYMQEFKKGPEGADEKVRQALNRVFVNHMAGAKYLLPYIESQNGNQKGMRFMIVTMNPGQDKYLPVFTDRTAFMRFNNNVQNPQVKMLVLDFRQLSAFNMPEGAKGFVINPADLSAPLPMDYIKNVVSAMDKSKEKA